MYDYSLYEMYLKPFIGAVIVYALSVVFPPFFILFIGILVLSFFIKPEVYSDLVEQHKSSTINMAAIKYIAQPFNIKSTLLLCTLSGWVVMYMLFGYNPSYSLFEVSQSTYNTLLGIYMLLTTIVPIKVHLYTTRLRNDLQNGN